jgi:hypothetical protein
MVTLQRHVPHVYQLFNLIELNDQQHSNWVASCRWPQPSLGRVIWGCWLQSNHTFFAFGSAWVGGRKDKSCLQWLENTLVLLLFIFLIKTSESRPIQTSLSMHVHDVHVISAT